MGDLIVNLTFFTLSICPILSIFCAKEKRRRVKGTSTKTLTNPGPPLISSPGNEKNSKEPPKIVKSTESIDKSREKVSKEGVKEKINSAEDDKKRNTEEGSAEKPKDTVNSKGSLDDVKENLKTGREKSTRDSPKSGKRHKNTRTKQATLELQETQQHTQCQTTVAQTMCSTQTNEDTAQQETAKNEKRKKKKRVVYGSKGHKRIEEYFDDPDDDDTLNCVKSITS